MKTKSYLILACVTALVVCAPVSATARAKASASPNASASPTASAATSPAPKTAPPAASPGMKAARAIPFRGIIASVDMRAKTFTIAGKEKSRVFKITDKTAFMKGGMPATMKEVAEKEEVRGSYWKNADGSLEAKSVKLGPKTEAEKAAAAKKSASKKTKPDSNNDAASPSASASPSPAKP